MFNATAQTKEVKAAILALDVKVKSDAYIQASILTGAQNELLTAAQRLRGRGFEIVWFGCNQLTAYREQA